MSMFGELPYIFIIYFLNLKTAKYISMKRNKNNNNNNYNNHKSYEKEKEKLE